RVDKTLTRGDEDRSNEWLAREVGIRPIQRELRMPRLCDWAIHIRKVARQLSAKPRACRPTAMAADRVVGLTDALVEGVDDLVVAVSDARLDKQELLSPLRHPGDRLCGILEAVERAVAVDDRCPLDVVGRVVKIELAYFELRVPRPKYDEVLVLRLGDDDAAVSIEKEARMVADAGADFENCLRSEIKAERRQVLLSS